MIKRFWRENRILILILAMGLALRLFVVFAAGEQMFLGTDDENYMESAEKLLRTGVLTYSHWAGPTVFIMPGYPILLSLVFFVTGGTSWLAARLMQVAVSMAALWLSVKMGERLGGRGVGLLTGLILAVYPPNLTAPDFLMTETVFTFSMLLALYWFDLAAENGRTGRFLLTGAAVALGTYFRPTAGLLPAVFFVCLLIKGRGDRRGNYWLNDNLWLIKERWHRGDEWRRAILGTVIMGVTLVVLLSPWIIRNYIQFKEIIPFTVSSGNPFLRGTYINGEIIVRNKSERFPWVEGSHILSDRAQMEFGKKRLKEGLQADFWGYLRWYTIGKFADFWSGPYYYKELSFLSARPVQIFHDGLLITGAAGLFIGLIRRKWAVTLIFLVSGYFTLIHMVYLTGPRYSYPTMQLLGILAAYGLVEGGRALTGRTG